MTNGGFNGSIVVLIILLLLCFPAGLIYLLVKMEEVRPPQGKACAWCGAIIPMNYLFCTNCGRQQYAPPQYGQQPYQGGYGQPNYAPPVQRERNRSPKFCGKCGTPTDGISCPSCGAKYEQ